ncbi:uncharacterized protein LOC129312031 [Prosopis cineraria]|uniref:uncharacterized protein LOC129312031 n=1 Tax=Prosopis cineraria TaxID=364024 RepID=UPI00240EA4A7|nr:uncharacterized protein LOC129312031 [Prosopis cineraria]
MGSKDVSKLKWKRRRQMVDAARSRRGSSVDKKIKKLRQLIPGGIRLNPDRLLLQTAEHILQLRLQVNVLKALSEILKLK